MENGTRLPTPGVVAVEPEHALALAVKSEMNAKRNNNAHGAASKRTSDDYDAARGDGDTVVAVKRRDYDDGGQARKRKSSLRKGILGKNMMRDRNDFQDHQQHQQHHGQRGAARSPSIAHHMTMPAEEDETTPRRFAGYEMEKASLDSSISSDGGWPSSSTAITPRHLASTSRSSLGTYASTTDEDDATTYFRPSTSGNGASYGSAAPLPSSPAMLLQRRRSNRSAPHPSPLMVQTPVDLTLHEEWDYSETEWWGWVILVVTWLVFVVGMGSCLDVWSWAWDVGETPYAPPELEDDPTLPITGYYPALMLCTVVMAWIWVVVAWVGMKYFRHAKVVADDG